MNHKVGDKVIGGIPFEYYVEGFTPNRLEVTELMLDWTGKTMTISEVKENFRGVVIYRVVENDYAWDNTMLLRVQKRDMPPRQKEHIKADNLRDIANRVLKSQYDEIMMKAAKEGKYFCIVNGLSNKFIKQFEKDGFKVVTIVENDERKHKISWE